MPEIHITGTATIRVDVVVDEYDYVDKIELDDAAEKSFNQAVQDEFDMGNGNYDFSYEVLGKGN